MTSKRSVKALLKKARLRSEPFSVAIGDQTVTGTLTAMPFIRWQEIKATHPPRDGNAVDQGMGYSYAQTWPDMIRAAVTDPEMDDEDWGLFFDLMAEGDLARLAVQVMALNEREGRVDVPKSSSTSPATTSPNSD